MQRDDESRNRIVQRFLLRLPGYTVQRLESVLAEETYAHASDRELELALADLAVACELLRARYVSTGRDETTEEAFKRADAIVQLEIQKVESLIARFEGRPCGAQCGDPGEMAPCVLARGHRGLHVPRAS